MEHRRTLPIVPPHARAIEWFPGHAATADGQILSCRKPGRWQPRYTDDWRVMRTYARPVYRSVTLWRDNTPHHIYVHKLILLTFVGPRPVHAEACHLNGDLNDNRAKNLQWATHRMNESHKEAHGTAPKGERNGAAILTEAIVKAIRADRMAGVTQKLTAIKYGISQPTVCNIARGKTWRHIH